MMQILVQFYSCTLLLLELKGNLMAPEVDVIEEHLSDFTLMPLGSMGIKAQGCYR